MSFDWRWLEIQCEPRIDDLREPGWVPGERVTSEDLDAEFERIFHQAIFHQSIRLDPAKNMRRMSEAGISPVLNLDPDKDFVGGRPRMKFQGEEPC